MRAISALLVSLAVTASQALAAGGAPEAEGSSLMAILCVGFLVMVVLFQFLPGMTLLLGALRGLFTSGSEAAHRGSNGN